MRTARLSTKRARRVPALAAAALLLALACAATARADDAAAPAPAAAAPPAATAATVGLLPIHGVAVDLDALPGEGRGSERNAAQSTAALQTLWDGYLKGAGFNVIGFPVDVHDLGERGAIRVARLCTWAKQNNVRLAPNLVGAPEGKPLPADYPQLAAAFVGKVIAELGTAGAPAYAQIMLYQLGRPLNHPASHGPMEAAAASAVLKAAAESVRATEQAALASSGMQASPLLVSVSMDYELIRRGAIAHTPLTDESYQGAADAASDWLATVLGAAPVEAVAIEWFPGSLSSEGVERMPDLMTRLQADLPGKLLLMDTGFSSAAGSDTAQARFYALTLNNLCDLRARQGVDSPFAGILWRNAVDGGTGGAKPLTPDQIAKQDWGARAKDLDRMWTDPKADPKEARSWLAGIQSNFGLISRASSSSSGLAPKTAFVVISRLETALARSPQASDALAAVQELVSSDNGGVGTKIKTRLQSAMFGLLDAFLSKTAENLFAPESAPAPAAPGAAVALPDVQIVDVGMLPASGTVNAPISIPVTLFNAGAAPATDAAVYLRDQASDLAHSNPTVLSPGATTTVQLTWTPTRSGRVAAIALDAYCNNDADPQTNHADLGDLQVNAGTTPPKPPRHISDVRGQIGGVLATSDVTTQTTPGFVHITDLSTSMVFATPTRSSGAGSTGSGGGGSTGSTSVRMAPAPGSGDGAAGSTSARPIAPAAPAAATGSPVTMTLVNPFGTAFRSTVATLRVDGRSVAERDLGTMLPGQRRSVSFTEWTPPAPGAYRVQVDLRGVGPQGKPLTSSATSQVVIVGEDRSVRTTPPASPMSAPVRTPFATRTMMPLVRPASSQTLPAMGARPFGRPGAPGVRGLVGGAVLGLSANSIVLRPFPPAAGAPLDVSVQLNNAAGAAAGTAQVRLSVDGEDLGLVNVGVPAAGFAMASGFRSWAAKPGRHDFRAVVTMGGGRAEASKAVFVSPGGARGFGRPLPGGASTGVVAGTPSGTMPGTRGIQTGPRPVTPLGGGAKPTAGAPTMGGAPGLKPFAKPPGAGGAPDLQLASTDLRVAPPAPTAGSSAVVSLNVRNVGSAPAMGGTVLLVLAADGKEVARTQLGAAVTANGVLALQWPITVPAGAWSVTATATAPGDANPNNNVARAAPATRLAPTRAPLASPAVLTPTGR